MPSAISINKISKRFNQLQALDEINFNIESGEFFALLGANGAGKTTLISALAGLSRQDSGSIKIMGFDTISEAYQARKSLGVVPQELVFDPFLTVRETLNFQSGYFGINNNKKWIDELLSRLSLEDKANANMRSLSGGMKRRVMVAQALVHRPRVIVLDEPTAGVDVELRQSLWTFIKELNQAGHTILLTTHYLEEAQDLCNRIAMLKHGKLVALEDKSVLLQRAAIHEVSLKLSAPLPSNLNQLKVREDDAHVVLRLDNLAQIESILSTLRQAQIEVKELSVPEINLEDVFVSIMYDRKPL